MVGPAPAFPRGMHVDGPTRPEGQLARHGIADDNESVAMEALFLIEGEVGVTHMTRQPIRLRDS